MSGTASLQAAWARADRAKVREITAHRRAITFQEDAVARFELRGLVVYAAAARERAERARVLLHAALDEQAETSAHRLRWSHRTVPATGSVV